MFKIAVCDDEQAYRNTTIGFITNYMEKNKIMYEIDEFESGKDFAALGIEMIQYTVIFLEINMTGLDGMKLASKIRKMSKEIFIVIVTADTNYSIEAYKFDVVRYLLKGSENFEKIIEECLETIVEKVNYKITHRSFHFTGGHRKIPLTRLLYIESKLHKLEFHVMENTMQLYAMYGTLNDLEHDLAGNDFIRIHQSFLVNMRYIKNISRYKAILNNGKELIIPKARYHYVKDSFTAYQEKNHILL